MADIRPPRCAVDRPIGDITVRLYHKNRRIGDAAVFVRVEQIIDVNHRFVDITEQFKRQPGFRLKRPGLFRRIGRQGINTGVAGTDVALMIFKLSQLADAERSPVPPVKNKQHVFAFR